MKRRVYSFILTTVILGLFAVMLMGCTIPNDSDNFYWNSLGNTGVGWNTPIAIAIDPSNNKPVWIYTDTDNSDARVYVAKHP